MNLTLRKTATLAVCALLVSVTYFAAANAEQSADTLKGFKADTLVIWNQHNGKAKDRGTEKVNLALYDGDKVVWRKDDVALEWKPTEDVPNRFKLPDIAFTKLRIEITKWKGRGGGLAEVEVLRGRDNIAKGKSANASSVWEKDWRFGPEKINDSITSSGRVGGYWLLQTDAAGWVEIDFTQAQEPHKEKN